MKSGAKSGSGFRTRFWGPLVLAHFPQAPKTVPFPGPNFGRRGTAATLTLELAFGVAKSGRGSKISATSSPITQTWHPVPFVQLQPKSRFKLAACTR